MNEQARVERTKTLEWASDAQRTALDRLSEQRGEPGYLQREPFDLPAGYLLAGFPDGFMCGISREGDVSS